MTGTNRGSIAGDGKVFAMFGKCGFVVKLPKKRVDELAGVLGDQLAANLLFAICVLSSR